MLQRQPLSNSISLLKILVKHVVFINWASVKTAQSLKCHSILQINTLCPLCATKVLITFMLPTSREPHKRFGNTVGVLYLRVNINKLMLKKRRGSRLSIFVLVKMVSVCWDSQCFPSLRRSTMKVTLLSPPLQKISISQWKISFLWD